MKSKRTTVVATTILLLLGCGQSGSKAYMPSSPALQSLYIQSCYSCHSSGVNGAPRSGNRDDWQPRLNKGLTTLVQHTVDGFNAMPARGMCIDCSGEDYQALIMFMASPAQPSPNSSKKD